MATSEITHKVYAFLQHLADECSRENGLGSMTPTVYDTAWVSMISKSIDGKRLWLFPECFEFVLNAQLPNGGWESYATVDDGILNTMAALLAMKKHGSNPAYTEPDGPKLPLDLEVRMSKAIVYLQNKLEDWDVQGTNNTDIELLVPAHLSMLEAENITFNFPKRKYLMSIHRKTFDPLVLYGKKKTTFLCLLEAFVGKLDFDRVSHHKRFGSMMGSPASTAAYLINSSSWDSETESFLRTTMLKGQRNGSAGLPMLFPGTIWELVWPISTLVEHRCLDESLGTTNIDRLASYLEKHLLAQNGHLGFAPSMLEDADCTAKTVLTLNLLGRPTPPDRMIDLHRALQMDGGERAHSLSENCNVLNALLHSPDVPKYSNHIFDIAKFLCDAWWDGKFQDKRNLSLYYSMMLLADALMNLLRSWESGQLAALPQDFVSERISVVLIEICNRTLLGQNSDGSWGPPEVTAYAVLALVSISSLPHVGLLETEISSAIKTGRHFLSQSQDRWAEPQYVWIGKVTYGVSAISLGYCLSALGALPRPYSSNGRLTNLVIPPSEDIEKNTRIFCRLPMYAKVPRWKVKASVLEAYSLLPGLKRAQEDIFPHRSQVDKTYPDFVPCLWTITNNCGLHFLNLNLLWEMVMCSLLITLLDGYLESVVAQLPPGKLDSVEEIARFICDNPDGETEGRLMMPDTERENSKERQETIAFNGKTYPEFDSDKHHMENSVASPELLEIIDETAILSPIKLAFESWVKYFLSRAEVRRASPYDKENLRYELHVVFQTNLTQIRDSDRLSHNSRSTKFLNPRASFHKWVHTTAANDTFFPFSWAFFNCLVGGRPSGQHDCFSSALAKYFARDLCDHLAVTTRLYNDYSSVGRDHAEQNLNSVDFPEFHIPDSSHARQLDTDGDADAVIGDRETSCNNDDTNLVAEEQQERDRKSHVLALAHYERQCTAFAKDHLVNEMGKRGNGEHSKWAQQAVSWLVENVECYSELCMFRDSTVRVK